MIRLTLFLLLLFSATASAQIRVIASGRVQGDVHPCECEKKPVGGLAQRVAQVGALLEASPGAIWLDAGNGLYDSPNPVPGDLMPLRRLQSITLVDAYNLGGLSAHNIGPLDLAEGVEYLHRLELRAVFPFLSANLLWTADQPQEGLHFEPDLLLRLSTAGETHSVGVVGLMAGGLQGYGWATSDPVRAAKDSIRSLRDRGAQRIVLLASIDTVAALKLAKRLPRVDLIVVSGEGALPEEGVRVKKTLVVRSAARGRGVVGWTLGQFDTAIDSYPIQREGPSDPRVLRLVSQMEARATLPVDPPAGEVPASMDGSAPFLPPQSEQELMDQLPVETLEPNPE